MCELAHIPWAKYLARSEGRPGKGQYRNGLTRLSHHGDRKMTSPYLEQPFVPLVVALPQMAEQIEAELVGKKLAGRRSAAPPPARRIDPLAADPRPIT